MPDPNYLSKKDWRLLLDAKENKAVKKTGISELLDGYATAEKGGNAGKKLAALEKIVNKADALVTTVKVKAVSDYLAKMSKAAANAQLALTKLIEEPPKKKAEEKDKEPPPEPTTLGKDVVKARAQKREAPWNFVLAPGKPASGLVVTRKAIQKANIDAAQEMRGKRGVYFQGICYGEGNTLVLELEATPPSGLAKAARIAILTHGNLKAKVVVRGGGVELDGESDADLVEEGGQRMPTSNEGKGKAWNDRLDKMENAVTDYCQKVLTLPAGTEDGLYGAIRLMKQQLKDDTEMRKELRGDIELRVGEMERQLRDALEKRDKPKPEVKSSPYPTLEDWTKLASEILRLDPEKRRDAIRAYVLRLEKVGKLWETDKSLKQPAIDQQGEILAKARELGERLAKSVEEIQKDKDPELISRMQRADRLHEMLMQGETADPNGRQVMDQLFQELKLALAKGTLTKEDKRLGQLEVLLNGLGKKLRQRQVKTEEQRVQDEAGQRVSGAMPLLRKAGQLTGVIKDQGAIKTLAKAVPQLIEVIRALDQAQKSPSSETTSNLLKSLRKLPSEALTENPALASLVEDMRKRATAQKLVQDFDALGEKPWDSTKVERAQEIEAEYLFLESALSGGKQDLKAPVLGQGETGASGAWWIEQGEGSGKVSRKFIFKPGTREARAIPGVTPGQGAPREVLAKTLDTLLTGYGITPGVSPTSLARIDTAYLQGVEGEGEMVGSMQQLAPSDGPVANRIEDMDKFLETVDRKNFEDLAVFDMVFGNVDRHSKNMLYRTDPQTGKSILVPIDHGAGLLEPSALAINSRDLGPKRNFLAEDGFTPNQQPFSGETLEGLARMDPDRMAEEMKRARTGMSDRHGAQNVPISDEAIDAMAGRVRFVKAAAALNLPVRDVFAMLSQGAARIAKCKPEDMADLVQTLQREIEAGRKDQKVLQSLSEELASEKLDLRNAMAKLLSGLGWSSEYSDFDAWVAGNPGLVTKILRHNIRNPNYQTLLEEARRSDPEIDKKLGVNPTVWIKKLMPAIHKGLVEPATESDEEKVELFKTLGGAKELQLAIDAIAEYKFTATVDEDGVPSNEQLEFLRAWNVLKGMGGIEGYMALGGVIPRGIDLLYVIQRFEMVKRGQALRKEIEKLPDELTEEEVDENWRKSSLEFDEVILTVTDEMTLRNARGEKLGAEKLWEKGKTTMALMAVTNALSYIRLRKEVDRLELLMKTN